PWLRISVKADDAKDAKPGILSKVVYVQRVSTSGGVKPKDLPIRADSKVAVEYTAVYYFWAKDDGKEKSSSQVEFKDGKATVTGEFTKEDPVNKAGRREKKYSISGEAGRVYKITREGATYWQWIKDSEDKLIVQGWPGDSAPPILSYFYEPHK